MARINMVQIVMALALAAVLLHGTAAEDYTVGNNMGWTNSVNSTFYSAWASSISRFEVGDELLFNFTTGSHDVAIVSKDAYDACTTANLPNVTRTGPATVRLNNPGAQYFICTVGGHCSAGQKLSINVFADDDTPPSPPPAGTPPTTGTTSPPPPPPPSPSSASSRGVAFAFVLISLAVAFFC